jgi:hypothetical protein
MTTPGDPTVEVEEHDAGRRDGEDPGQQALLLLVPRALLAQLVGHPVVDADQPVHLGLADLAEAGGEVALGQEPRGLLEGGEVAAQRPPQGEPAEERDCEGPLDGEQPQPLAPQHEVGEAGEQEVDEDEVDEQASRQAHAFCPYFSSRR